VLIVSFLPGALRWAFFGYVGFLFVCECFLFFSLGVRRGLFFTHFLLLQVAPFFLGRFFLLCLALRVSGLFSVFSSGPFSVALSLRSEKVYPLWGRSRSPTLFRHAFFLSSLAFALWCRFFFWLFGIFFLTFEEGA